MNIGEINILRVSRNTPHGLFLEDDQGESVLLPGKYLKGTEKEGDEVEVFIYNDSEDRLIATTENPKIHLNEFAVLKVIDVTKYGVFMDWGLEKDLLVPFKEQNKKMKLGNSYVVRMYLDEDTDRLVATGKINRFLSNEPLDLKENDSAELIIYNQSELGYDVIINEKHQGLLFRNEVFTPVKIGDKLTGFIKQIRADGKIDVSLQPAQPEHLEKSARKILEVIRSEGGSIKISDKSPPDVIYSIFGMSKKTFKRVVGNLYKQRKIIIEAGKLVLND